MSKEVKKQETGNTKPAKEDKETKAVDTKIKEVDLYRIETLIKNSKALTGYQPEIAKVALKGIKDPMSKEDFKKKLNKFASRKITDNKKKKGDR